jgi:hypothetical protein
MNRIPASPPHSGPSYYGDITDPRLFVKICFLENAKKSLKLAQKALKRVKKARQNFTKINKLKRKKSISGYQKYFFRLLKNYKQKRAKYLMVKNNFSTF